MSTWDCLSCGAGAQTKIFCESCGAAQPVEGDDSALSLVLGLVCETCDAYNDPGVAVCVSCGTPLGSGPLSPEPLPDETPALPGEPPPPVWMTPPTGNPLATAFALPKVDLGVMAKNAGGLAAPTTTPAPLAASETPRPLPPPVHAKEAPCPRCGNVNEPGDKFCRNCGARTGEAPPASTTQIQAARLPAPGLPSPILGVGATAMMPAFRSMNVDPGAGSGPHAGASATMMFGAVTVERSAKLVLVRGASSFGTQWRLQAGETSSGRTDGVVLFPDDDTLAAKHARLSFVGNDLILDPLPSTNGVYLRVKEPMRLSPGDEIVIGAQRLVVLASEDRPSFGAPPDASTHLLGSLLKPAEPIILLRVAQNEAEHEVYYRCQRLLTLGRNHCDLNFPRDSFVSERHAQIGRNEQGVLMLEDLRSRNGTYLRALKPTKLVHGDLLLLGDKVLRVELPQR